MLSRIYRRQIVDLSNLFFYFSNRYVLDWHYVGNNGVMTIFTARVIIVFKMEISESVKTRR